MVLKQLLSKLGFHRPCYDTSKGNTNFESSWLYPEGSSVVYCYAMWSSSLKLEQQSGIFFIPETWPVCAVVGWWHANYYFPNTSVLWALISFSSSLHPLIISLPSFPFFSHRITLSNTWRETTCSVRYWAGSAECNASTLSPLLFFQVLPLFLKKLLFGLHQKIWRLLPVQCSGLVLGSA